MSHFKMSTSRDFRINASIIQTALEKNAEESDCEHKENGGESDEQVRIAGMKLYQAFHKNSLGIVSLQL